MQTRLKTCTIQRQDYSVYFVQSHLSPILSDLTLCGYTSLMSITESCEPSSYETAVNSVHWKDAMVDELTALQRQGIWELVPPPLDKNITGSKWVYKVKRDQHGLVSRYKARLVAQGFSQEQRLNYEDTFSLVV